MHVMGPVIQAQLLFHFEEPLWCEVGIIPSARDKKP